MSSAVPLSGAAPGCAAAASTLPVSAQRLASAERSENFPVALRALPRSRRRDLRAVYGVVRVIDDLGDEADGDRSALLTSFAADIDRAFSPSGPPRAAVLRELRAAPGFARLEAEPFRRLVRANLADQTVTSYASVEDLVGYCRLSADPVGRIVLALFDAVTPERVVWSDRICTALQILEHCQDVAEDRARGRVYLPADDLRRFGVAPADLDATTTSPALRRAVGFQVDRAAGMLDAGLPLVRSLTGWARVAVAGFAAGGLATADALRAADFDVLRATPHPTKARTARRAVELLRGRR